MSILYCEPLREIKKSSFKIGDRVRISQYGLAFKKGYTPQFRRENFEIVAISSKKLQTYTKKLQTYTKKVERDEFIHDKFHRKYFIKII